METNTEEDHDKLLALADQVAEEAHRGQTRKDGETPYITHPRKVAEDSLLSWSADARAAALLHDVVENTDYPVADLVEMFPSYVMDIVMALTRVKGESYEEYIHLVGGNMPAARVKIADILHNLGDDPFPEKVAIYRRSLLYLMGKGNLLKECPFCGEEVSVVERNDGFYVVCPGASGERCMLEEGARVPELYRGWRESARRVICQIRKHWNQRTEEWYG